jgi:quercetin dioxygenase-like cupin family protein
MPTDLRSTVLVRGEETGDALSVVENLVAPRSAGPPLHRHDFDEAFYLLDGELVLRVGDELRVLTAGQLALAPRGTAHALANRRDDPARYLLVCAPAGFERDLARATALADGTPAPPWALRPGPEVVRLGPPIPRDVLDRLG